VWGFDPLYVGAPCDLRASFQVVIGLIVPEAGRALPDQLHAIGIGVHDATELDLNADGLKDWVLVLDLPKVDLSWPEAADAWAVITQSNGYIPLRLSSARRPLQQFATGDTVEVVTLATEGQAPPLVVLHAAETLYTFRIYLTPDGIPQARHAMSQSWYASPSFGSVSRFTPSPSESPPTLTVYANRSCPGCADHYVWEAATDMWRLVAREGGRAALPNLERQLWAGTEPARVASELESLLAAWGDFDPARAQYLLGLAYELSGDDTAAVEAYWQLWQEHAASLYARMAAAKLERSD
jgi:hypothetical protein